MLIGVLPRPLLDLIEPAADVGRAAGGALSVSMRSDLLALLPEALLFLGGMLCLVGGSFTPRTRQWRMRLAGRRRHLGQPGRRVSSPGWARTVRVFSGTFAVDTATGAARVIVTSALLLLLVLAGGEAAATTRARARPAASSSSVASGRC